MSLWPPRTAECCTSDCHEEGSPLVKRSVVFTNRAPRRPARHVARWTAPSPICSESRGASRPLPRTAAVRPSHRPVSAARQEAASCEHLSRSAGAPHHRREFNLQRYAHRPGLRVLRFDPGGQRYSGGFAGGGGRYVEYLQIKNTSGASCQLDAKATLTLTSLCGADASAIRGNPAVLVIDWKLEPKEILRREWVWPRWCDGAHGKWGVSVSVAGLSAEGKSGTPTCLENDQPSLLYPGF